MARVAIKLSGAQIPAAVIINDQGVTTVLAVEPDEKCEMCGEMKECRSYGPRKADGVRMRVCFDCAHKNEAELHRAFNERIEGRS
jgi:flavoprotein